MKSEKLKKGGENWEKSRKDRWLLIQKDIRKDRGGEQIKKNKTK